MRKILKIAYCIIGMLIGIGMIIAFTLEEMFLLIPVVLGGLIILFCLIYFIILVFNLNALYCFEDDILIVKKKNANIKIYKEEIEQVINVYHYMLDRLDVVKFVYNKKNYRINVNHENREKVKKFISGIKEIKKDNFSVFIRVYSIFCFILVIYFVLKKEILLNISFFLKIWYNVVNIQGGSMLNNIKKLFFIFLMAFAVMCVVACNEEEKTPTEEPVVEPTPEVPTPEVPTPEEPTPEEPTPEPTPVVQYVVTFDVDGVKETIEVKDGEKVSKPLDPAKDGYKFLGWYAGDALYDFEAAVTSDITLTAKFEIDYSKALDALESEVTLDEGATFEVKASYEVKVVSSDEGVVSVNDNVLTAVKAGVVTVTVTVAADEAVTKEITVTVNAKVVAPLSIEIEGAVDVMYMDSEIVLQAVVLPEGAKQEFTWKCMNRTKATIEENGAITPLRGGDARFVVTCAEDTSIKAEVTINIKSYIDPDKFINRLHVENPIAQIINVTGYQFVYKHVLLGGVFNYLFEDLNIIDYIIPEGTSNRPGTIMKPYYVTVHDTASSSSTAGALTHAKYWTNGGGGTSIHFTTGNDGVYRVLPYNEVAYHAGDGTGTPLSFTDTGIKATSDEPAKVTLSSDGYFEMNGEKTSIKAPLNGNGQICKNSDLPYTGINNYVDAQTGTYWIGNTWWSSTYKTLSNRGGNLNSVGIETCVDQGSSLWYTWAITAKLVGADILPKNALLPRDVKQHNTFSGKNCPQTMREANRWESFMDCVEAEYDMYTYFRNWTIEFSCDSQYVGSNGIVKSLPNVETEVTYTIKFSNGSDYDKTFTFTSKLAKASDYVI